MQQTVRGQCFHVSFDVMEALVDTGAVEPKLVHGLPVGRGPSNRGERYWHAWNELEMHGVVRVFDFTSQCVDMTREEYYRIGQLDEEHVWRYTHVDVDEMTAAHGTYGPWVEGWEAMGA